MLVVVTVLTNTVIVNVKRMIEKEEIMTDTEDLVDKYISQTFTVSLPSELENSNIIT